MIKTAWNREFYDPKPDIRVSKDSIKKSISDFLETHGASMVEHVAEHIGKTHVAARHLLAEMKREGYITNKRLRIAGNATYWALTIEQIDAIDTKRRH